MANASQKSLLPIVAAAAAAIVIAGCASEAPKPTEAKPATPAAQPAPLDVKPAAPAAPEIPPAEAKPMAAKLALQAVDQLQVGDEAAARTTIEQALKLDPANELAKKLSDQINADAQRELGAVHFRYTVQPADTLSKLAQQYMGDRFRFWILAKYNDIGNPSRLAAGQVIKIPGRQPATPPPPVAEPSTQPAAAPAPAPAPEPRPELADAMKRGAEQEKAGNLEAAYATYVDAASRYPTAQDAAKKRDATKVALIRQLDREASQAFQRQNLDLAITKWDRVLELDPNNKNARLKREQALDLKKRMAEKFGGKN